MRTRSLPRVNKLEHRWPWIETRLAPNFRRLDRDHDRLESKLRRIIGHAAAASDRPCASSQAD